MGQCRNSPGFPELDVIASQEPESASGQGALSSDGRNSACLFTPCVCRSEPGWEMPGGQVWGWSLGWCDRQLPLGDVALAPGPGSPLAVKLIRHQCTLCSQALDWAVASGQP